MDTNLFLIRQPFSEQEEEDILCPSIIFRVAGGQFALPVEFAAKVEQLFLHLGYVAVGPLVGHFVAFNGCIFCRESKGVPAHRVQDLERECG